MTQPTFEHADILRQQLRELRKVIDRRDPVQRETERLLASLVRLMGEAASIAAQQARLLQRADEIQAEVATLAERLQRLGAGKAAAPTTPQ